MTFNNFDRWFTESLFLANLINQKCCLFSYPKFELNHWFFNFSQAIGNHEFDNGPAGLVDFVKQAAFSMVCSNMNVSAEPVWPNPPIYVPSIVLERAGKKIGIIGYTTPDNTW